MKLSILICTTETRVNNFLPVIVQELALQSKDLPVEVLYLGDNKKRSVGQKRNDLIDLAQGEYFTFVDDDDRVAPTYVKDILKQIEKQPDLITFYAFRMHNGKNDRIVMYDFRYPKDENKEGRYQRMPNHLMCWRKEAVKDFRFIASNYGEDSDWAKRIKTQAKIKKVVEIKKVLYYYDFNINTTETQNF